MLPKADDNILKNENEKFGKESKFVSIYHYSNWKRQHTSTRKYQSIKWII